MRPFVESLRRLYMKGMLEKDGMTQEERLNNMVDAGIITEEEKNYIITP